MDAGKYVGMLVAFLVGALVLTAFVPIIDSTQHTIEKTINQNDGYNHTMDLLNNDVLITIDYTSGENEITVNVGDTDYSVDVSQTSSNSTWLFYSDVCMLWVDRVAGANTPVYALKSTGYTGNMSNSSSSFTYDNSSKEVELTINGNVVFTDTVEKFAYVYSANDGKYGYFTNQVTVEKNTTIELFRGGGWWDNTYVAYTATANDWYNSVTVPIAGMVITKDSTPIEYDAVYSSSYWIDNGNGTYTRTASSTSATFNNGESDTTISQNTRIIAPIEYVSYEENPTSDVIGLLPLVAGAGLLISAVAYFLRRY